MIPWRSRAVHILWDCRSQWWVMCRTLVGLSVLYLLLLNVDALREVQTSGPNDTKLVTRGPIFISGKYGSRGRYIEQIKTEQNIDQQD